MSREYAADKLRQIARCKRVVPFRPGDEDLTCANDWTAIVATPEGWIHDPDEVRRLRREAK